MKIRHISDVHIRNLTRHEQYRQVFNNLYQSLKQNKVDIICLLGDIRHSKTNISPQYVKLTTQFLYNLSDIATIHMIIGNHDCNMSNLSRLDAVSPIVDAIHGKTQNQIFLYKHSGIYKVSQNFQFLVCSMLDFQNFKLQQNQLGDNIRISLFHGTTKDAHNKYGFMFKQAYDFVQLLQKYSDYGFFGDIHTAQIMQNPKFRYSGSLIQQDFGQQLNKGYMIWDIQSKQKYDVKFISLQNSVKYITINVFQEKIPEIEDIKDSYNIRFLFQPNLKSDFIKSVVNNYKSKCARVTYTKKDDISSRKVKFDQGQVIQIHDRKFLLTKYFQKKQQQVDIQQLCKLDQIISSQLKDDYYDKKHRVTWSLQDLKWKNIFNFGGYHEFNFKRIQGLNGVFGPNRSGKSSFLNIIMVAIYGYCPKADDVKKILTQNQLNGNTQIILNSNIGQFKIQRQFQYQQKQGRKNRKKSSIVKIYFRKDQNQQWQPQNKVDKIQTQKYIQSRFGKYQTLLLSAFARQSKIQNFINVKQRQRVDVLIQYFGLDVFSKLYSLANQKRKQLKILINSKQQESSDSIQKLIEDLNYVQQQIRRIQQIKIQHKKIVQDNESVYVNLHSQLYPVQQNDKSQNQIQNQIQKNLNQIHLKKQRMVSLQLKDDIQQNIQKLQQLEQKIKKIQKIKIKAQRDFSRTNKDIQKYSDIRQHDICKKCPMMIDFKLSQTQKNQTNNAIKRATQILNNLQLEAEQLKNNNNKVKQRNRLLKQIKYNQKIIKSLQCILQYKKQNIQKIQKNKIIKQKIKQVDIQFKKQKQKLDQYESSLKVNYIQRAKINNKIQSNKKAVEYIKQHTKRMQLLQQYCEAVNYQGIPKTIIDFLLPQFEDKINQIVSQMDDFKITFKLQNQLQILIDNRYIETASGMEQLIFSFAFRMRLAKYQYADLFVIDQAFSHLDPQNLIKAGQIRKTIPEYFTHVFLVQHNQRVKDFVDNTIQVRRVQGRSKIFI